MYNLCPQTLSHLCTSQREGNATSLLQQYTPYKNKVKGIEMYLKYLITFNSGQKSVELSCYYKKLPLENISNQDTSKIF